MNSEILGYSRLPDGVWEPLYECKPGYIYSAAIVSCQKCRQMIRSMGGPMHAVCVNCRNQMENCQ